jgi:tripartite-type tricarboxylate transporter receptor subunit TctC
MVGRRIVFASLAAAGFVLLTGLAQAQTYPSKLIKMIVPSPAGGQTDVLARFLAQHMQTALGQSVIIDNRPGAGGLIGARIAVAAEPDGYTIFFGNTSTLAVIPAVSHKAGYDPVKNFAPVSAISESYTILCVHPSFPAKTLAEFIAYAKAHPGKLNFGHAGAGNVTHLTGEMFRANAGVDFVGVPHRGGMESITALLGQQVDFVFESPVVLLPLIRDGKLRPLAVTSTKRSPDLPEVPSTAETMPKFVSTLLTGIVAPAGTPADAVARLNAVINADLKTAEMQENLAKFGSTPNILSPAEFGKYLADEKQKWTDVAKAAHVSID